MSLFRFYDNQEWDPFECDVPWETITLPKKEIFLRDRKNIQGKVKSISKYDGVWRGEDFKIEIKFLPKKNHHVRSKQVPCSVIGLVNASLKPNLHFFPLIKKDSKKKQKKYVIDYLNRRQYYRYKTVQSDEIFKKYRYKPIKEFIAQNYVDDYKKKKYPIENIEDFLILEQPTLWYSPHMNHDERLNHAIKLIPKIKHLQKEHQDRVKELDQFINFVKHCYSRGKPQILDELSEYSKKHLNIDLSLLIYNYEAVDEVRGDAKNGLYLYKRYNMVPLMIHSLIYPTLMILKAENTAQYLNIKRWHFLKDLYLVNENKYLKLKRGTKYVNLQNIQQFKKNEDMEFMNHTQQRTETFELFYLVQRHVYKNDIISVNLATKIEIKGSVRVKPLCFFKIYF